MPAWVIANHNSAEIITGEAEWENIKEVKIAGVREGQKSDQRIVRIVGNLSRKIKRGLYSRDK